MPRTFLKAQPFCLGCARFLTVAEARKHSKHARLIRWIGKK